MLNKTTYLLSYQIKLFMRIWVEFFSLFFKFQLFNLNNSTIKTGINLSVALSVSYSMLSASELWDGIFKTTSYLRMMDVFDSIEMRMLREASYVPNLFPTQGCALSAFRGCEHLNLWGACALSHSLLSLAFTCNSME